MRLGVLVLFAAQTLAAPYLVLDDHLPGATLKDNGCSALRFPGAGTRFVYEYAGETLNQVAGSTETTTGMRMTAKVSIARVSKCTYEMEIVSSKLLSKSATDKDFTKETKENHKFQHEMESHSILFSLGENGGISSLHAHKKDPIHIVNIKRGILSTLQLQKDSTTETDINGACDVTTSTAADGTITKSKDLTNCDKRGINEIGLQTSSIQSESSALKPLTSSSKCTFTVDENSIKGVRCEEEHLFRPFSAGHKTTSGAVTTVKQTLRKVKEDKSKADKPKIMEYTVNSGMLFDHSKEEMSNVITITSQVDEIMNRLVDKTGNMAAKQDSAHEFTALVQVLRKMDEKRMKPIWNKYFDCQKSKVCPKDDTTLLNIYRSYLLDAVTYCGTTTCVSMIRDVIVDGDVSGESMNMFLQGIAFVGKTSADMIKDVLHIVKKQPSRQAFLTLGTLLGRHCKNNPNECHYDKKSQITRAEIYLMDLLGKKCNKQMKPHKLEEMIMSLKAMANAGSPTKAFGSIIGCFENSEHTNLTVATMDAVRAMPCSHERSEAILSLVMNEKICPEKRSYAFRALMKCPDRPILHKLMHHMDKEPSKQLGSFMYTTLSNIAESSDPKNTAWREMMDTLTANDGSLKLKEINLPMHQFSHNYEKSFMIDSVVKSGLTAESDVIFNPDGYLPKSAFFNLTANVMGVPVHVVEAAVMVDGIETVLEDVFGKEGMFPETTILNIFNVTLTKERLQELTEKRNEQNDKKFAQKNRPKRAVEDNLTKMHKQINKDRTEPTGSISFKIMGQEVKVFSYDDLFWAIDKIDNMNVVTMLMDVAKGVKKTFTKSALVLEVTHEVATGLGIPLRLKLMGSAVSTLQLDGKFDIRNMFWGPMGMHINGLVRQSSVLEVSGSMAMESHFFSTGMFVNATSLSSQVVKGNIEYKQGKVLKVNIDTPDEPMQLFNFSSTPFMFLNEESTLIEGAPRKISPDACVKSVYIGLGVCTTIRAPLAYREYEAPYFPLSGPANFGVKLVKADPKLTTYQFLVDMKKSGKVTTGEISLSTPGATYERKVSANMKYAEEDVLRKLSIGTEEIGKGTEVDFIYNTETNSVALKSRSNLFKKMEYNVELFNETSKLGREYGIRVDAAFDWYKFNTENKLVLRKSGPMLITTTSYYPEKTATGSLELNTAENKLSANLDLNSNKQTIDILYNVTDGVSLTLLHPQSNTTVIVDGRLITTDNKKTLRLTGDVNGKIAVSELSLETTNTAYTVTATVNAAGKKGELVGKFVNDKDVELSLSADFNGKKAVLVGKLNATENKKTLSLTADVIGKTAATEFCLETTEKAYTLAATVKAAGKKAELVGKFVNDKDVELILSADLNGKKGEAKVGYYTPNEDRFAALTVAGKEITRAGLFVTRLHMTTTKSLKWEVNALEKKMEVFGTLTTTTEKRVLDIGASYNQFRTGAKFDYKDQHQQTRELCSSVYFNSDKTNIDPFLVCGKFETMSHPTLKTYVHKRVTFTSKLNKYNKLFKVQSDFEHHDTHATLKTFTTINEKTVWNIIDTTYGDLTKANFILSFGSGDLTKVKPTIGMQVYSKKTGDEQVVAVEGSFREKSIGFSTTYSASKGIINMKNEILVNKKALPVNTALRYYSNGVTGSELTLNAGEWAITTSTSVQMKKLQSFVNFVFTVKKGEVEKLKLYNKNSAVWTTPTKRVEQQIGAVIVGKTFQYGYMAEVTGTSMDKLYGKLRLDWSTKRYSSLALSFTDNKKETELKLDVEYLPKKTMTHSVLLEKKQSKVTISIEFLPKMFTKYSVKLDRSNGITLKQDMSVSWDKFEKSVSFVNKYINTDKKFSVSTSIGNSFELAADYRKADNPKVTLSAKVLKNLLELEGTVFPKLNKMNVNARFNNKEKASLTGSLESKKGVYEATLDGEVGKNKASISATYISKNKKSFKLTTTINKKTIGGFSAEYNGKANTASIAVQSGEKDVAELFARVNTANNAFIFKVNGKKNLLEIVARKTPKADEYFLKFNMKQLKQLVEFSAKLDRDTKVVTLAVQHNKITCGLKLRADWDEMISSARAFCNNKEIGWETKVVKNSVIFTLDVTPKHSIQMKVSIIKDKIIEVTISRISNKKVVKEVTFKFELTPKMVKLMLNLNKVSISKIVKSLKPHVELLTKHSKKVSKKAKEIRELVIKQAKTISKDVVKQAKTITKDVVKQAKTITKDVDLSALKASLYKINLPSSAVIQDQANIVMKSVEGLKGQLENIDFDLTQKKIGEVSLSTLRKVSDVTSKALLSASTGMDTLSKNLPTYINQTEKAIRDLQKLTEKAIEDLQAFIENNKADIQENLALMKQLATDISEIAVKLSANVTETAKPVVDKIIVLLKDFKIRKKTVAQWVEIVVAKLNKLYKQCKTEGTKLYKEYKTKGTKLFEEYKTKGTNLYKEYKTECDRLYKEYKTEGIQMYTKYSKQGLEKINKLIETGTKLAAELREKGTEYVLNIDLPYTNMTVEQTIEFIKAKVEEIKTKVEEIKTQVEDIIAKYDQKMIQKKLEKIWEQTRDLMLNYKTVSEKLAKKYYDIVKAEVDKLPAAQQKIVKDLQTMITKFSKKYNKQIDELIVEAKVLLKELDEFLKPLTDHIKFVKKSLKKNFGPLVKVVMKKLNKKIKALELPEFVAQIKNLELPEFVAQIKNIELVNPLDTKMAKELVSKLSGMKIAGKTVGSIVETAKQTLTKDAKKYQKMILELIEKIKTLVAELKEMKTEDVYNKLVNVTTDARAKAEIITKEILAKADEITKQMLAKADKITKEMIAKADKLIKETLAKANKIIKEALAKADEISKEILVKYKEILVRISKESRVLFAKLTKKYNELSVKSVEEFLTSSTKEMAIILKQLSEMKLDENVLAALKKIDITEITKMLKSYKVDINKMLETYKVAIKKMLKKYNVQEKLNAVLDSMKKINVTINELLNTYEVPEKLNAILESVKTYKVNVNKMLKSYEVPEKLNAVLDSINNINVTDILNALKKIVARLNKSVENIREIATPKLLSLYKSYEKVLNYIQSIPKKEYKVWKAEVKSFALNNTKALYEYVQSVYGILEPRIAKVVEAIYKDALNIYADASKMSVKELTKTVTELYETNFKTVTELYEANFKIVNKFYETYFKIVKEFYETNLKIVRELYDTNFDIAKEFYAAQSDSAKEIYDDVYDDVNSKYVLSSKLVKILARKAGRVYKEVAEPTRIVKEHYANISIAFYNKLSTRLMKLSTMAIDDVKESLSGLREFVKIEINKQMEFVKTEINKQYTAFLAKYGDKTWEEIAEIIKAFALKTFNEGKVFAETKFNEGKVFAETKFNEGKVFAETKFNEGKVFAETKFNEGKVFAEAKFNETKVIAEAEYKKLLAKIDELKTLLMTEGDKIMKKLNVEYEKVYAQALERYNEVLPRVKALYKKYSDLATAKVTEVRNVTMKYYKEIKAILDKYVEEAKKLYEANKKKTIPALAKEIKKLITEKVKLITDNLEVRYEILKNTTLVKVNAMIKKIEKLVKEKRAEYEEKVKTYYKLAEKKIKSIIPELLPELKIELESIINQTLRNSVEIYKESKKAFAAHIIVARKSIEDLRKSIENLRKPIEDLLAKFNLESATLQRDVKELMTNVQDNLIELYEKIVVILQTKLKEVRALDSVKKTLKISEKVKTLIEDVIEDVLELAKLKIDELKKHKIVLKYKKMTQKKFKEYQSKAENKFNKIKGDYEAKFNDIKDDYEIKFNEYKKVATEKYNKAKNLTEARYAEIKSKVMKYYNSPEMKKVVEELKLVLNEMKLIRQSITFTVNKLSEKVSPWIVVATPFIKQLDKIVIANFEQASEKFMENPEETFWKSINDMKATVEETVEFAKALDYEVPTMSAFTDDLKALVKDSTDDYAKKTYAKIVTEIKKVYKIIKNEVTRFQEELTKFVDNVPKYLKQQRKIVVEKFKAYREIISKRAEEQYKVLTTKAKAKADIMINKVKIMINKVKITVNKVESELLQFITTLQAKLASACDTIVETYKACPLKAINENPIWSEIAQEFYNHELVEATAQLFDISKKELVKITKDIKLNKLTDLIKKDIKRLFEILEAGKKIAMSKYADILITVEQMKTQLKTKANEIKSDYIKLQKESMTKIKDMQKESLTQLKDMQKKGITKVKDIKSDILKEITTYTAIVQTYTTAVQNFFEEKTIEDIVKLVQAKYDEGVEFAKEQYDAALEKKDEYIKVSEELFKEYRNKTELLYKEYKTKAIETYKEYKTKAIDTYKEYKTKAIEAYKEYEKKAIDTYKEYKTKAIDAYKEYKTKAIDTYNLYFKQLKTKYDEIEKIVIELFNEYKTILETYYKKYVEVEFNKVYKQVENGLKELDLEGKMNEARELAKTAGTKLKDGQKKIMDKKETMVKAIRTRLDSLKKMTVKETIAELQLLPNKTEVLIAKATTKANKLYEKVIKDLNVKYADLIKSGLKLKTRAIELKTEVLTFAKDKYDEVIVLVTPTYKSMKSTADAVTNEIGETAIFVYRYYRVQENMNKLQEVFDMKFSEFKKLVDGKINELKLNVDNEMKKYMPLITKFYEEYKTQVEEARTKLMQKVEEFKKEAKRTAEKYQKEAKRTAEKYQKEAKRKFVEYKKVAKKNYKEGLELLEVYKAKSFQLAKDLRAETKSLLYISADKVLRTIHSTLVLADETDLNDIIDLLKIKEKDLKAFLTLTYDDLVKYINNILDKVTVENILDKVNVQSILDVVTLEKVPIDFSVLTKSINKLRKELPKYIVLDKDSMQLTINIPHDGLLEPKFSDNLKTVKKVWPKINLRVRKSLKDATRQLKIVQNDAISMLKDLRTKVVSAMKVYKAKAMNLMKSYKTIGMKLYKEKTAQLLAQLTQLYEENALEHVEKALQFARKLWQRLLKESESIRVDLKRMYLKNRKLAIHMQIRGKIYYQKYSKQLRSMYKDFQTKHGDKFVKLIETMSKDIYKKVLATAKKVYNNPRAAYTEVSKMLTKVKVMIEKESKKAYKEYAPQAKLVSKKYYSQMKTKVEKLQKQLSGLTLPMKMSFEAMMRDGLDSETLAKHMKMYNKYQVKLKRFLTQQAAQLRKSICKKESKLCTMVDQAIKDSQEFIEEYGNMAIDKMTFQVDRNLRLAKRKAAMLTKVKSLVLEPTYRSVAMIFGRDHMITFDGKFYDFVDYKKKTCEYLLAHDFVNNKFTVKSTDDSLIIEVEDMLVKIFDDGKTKISIKGKSTTSLPVGTESGKCFRKNADVIACVFDKVGLKVMVDLKNTLTVIKMSGWHHGKTQGILGTNNREEFDDWKMPNGKVAQNVYQFANSYALTKRCNVKTQKTAKPRQQPSKRCEEIFKDADFGKHFDETTLKSFTKACKLDTSLAKKKDYKTAHCSSAVAAVIYAKSSLWKFIDLPKDCKSFTMADGTVHEVGSSWIQKPLKRAVDVVVLISERETVTKFSRTALVKTLDSLGKQLTRARYNTQFSLLGFGGHGVHEQSHHHPLGGDLFAPNMKKLTVEISQMPFTGVPADTNDAFDAILRATTMRFRPGASRVFIVYNSEPHTSHMFGPSHTETLVALTEEVDAALFVFDSFTFKNLKGSRGKIIGQSNGRMFSAGSKTLPMSRIGYPSSEFKQLVEASEGGMFSNNIKKHQPVSSALFKSLKFWLNKDTQTCRKCTLNDTWIGIASPVCKADPTAKC